MKKEKIKNYSEKQKIILKYQFINKEEKLNNSKIEKNEILLGISILRVLLCFWVIFVHCGKTKNETLKNILYKRTFHVPTFMFLSFFFSINIF